MDERIVQFRVGVMVLVVLILTAILVLLFGKMPTFVKGSYPLHIVFPDAPGVTTDTPVRRSGLLIGRVTDVEINEDETVTVTVAINSDVKLRRHHVCRLVSTLLGDSSLEFVKRDDPALSDEQVQPGETLTGVVASDPLQALANLEDEAQRMITSMTTASGDVSVTARRLTALVDANDEQFDRILTQTEDTLRSVQSAAASTESVFGDPDLRAGLNQALVEMPAAFRGTREAMETMERSFGHFEQTLSRADRNLENLEQFTRPLGQRGEQMFDRLGASAEKLDLVLDRLADFSAALNSEEGSLGRFIHDPSLYNNLNSAASNVDHLTSELRPILDDVRVFTDKIARDPGRLGVRGVFQQPSGVK
jgi:phospholipid/cholesterol/gamma-HCH transport system substrate-binding protein